MDTLINITLSNREGSVKLLYRNLVSGDVKDVEGDVSHVMLPKT